MSTTDGASTGGDPVLEGALSEMASEGTFNATATFQDPAPADASQTTSDASATKVAAPPPTGDDGSVKAGSSTASVVASGSSAAPPAAPDPLAGTEPFAYTVNGEARTLTWGHRVPGEGVLLTENEVPQLQALAERAEILDRVSRDLTTQNSTFERLSSWPSTDSDGKPTTLTGHAGLEAMRVENARKDGLISVIDSILTDPAKLLGLLAKDGQGNIVVDPAAVETLQMRAQLTADQAERHARVAFSKLGTVTPSSNGSTAPMASADHSASAPKLIQQSAGTNHAALLPEDHAELKADFGRYVRAVTDEDRRWNPALKVGAPIVDAAFGARVQRLANLRASAKQTATAAEKAGAHNAGMERGRQPEKTPPKPSTPPAKPGEAPRKKADWDSPFNEAMGELGIPIR